MLAPLSTGAQETKPWSDAGRGWITGTQTTTATTDANGHVTTTVTITGSGTNPRSGEYFTVRATRVHETDADGKEVSFRWSKTTQIFAKKGGEALSVHVVDQKRTTATNGRKTSITNTMDVDERKNIVTKTHETAELDAAYKAESAYKQTTIFRPGYEPLMKDERWNTRAHSWETLSVAGGQPKKTATGHPGMHPTAPLGARRTGKRTATLYLYGTITSLEGCKGEFYAAFPKVGSSSLDTGAATTKKGVFQFNGSTAEYDPYQGSLMADGAFHLTSSRSEGTTIAGKLHADNTITGTWHQVYDPSCSYTVTLTPGRSLSGSHVSVSGGGSWRIALSGLHQ